jgi:endosialidase-like protein
MSQSASPQESDVRLKEDITPLMRLDNGIGLYRYRYKWDRQLFVGVMAQEVADIVPTAVLRGQDGYLRVDYGQLGLSLMTWDEWVAREGDKPRLMQ